ncbi:MAG: HAD-IB family hydrolase [Acidimicrobiales bacterium]
MATAADLQETLAAIDSAPRGRRTAAFFDVDDTLMFGDLIGATATRSRRRIGLPHVGIPRIGPLRRSDAGDSKSDDAEDAIVGLVDAWQGQEESELAAAADRAFERKVADLVYPEARELIAAHRRKGHTVVLTASAVRHQVQPLADALGVDGIISSEPEVVNGLLTGKLMGPACIGPAKADAVEEYAATHGVELARSHAYASGDDAEALLLLVGTPHPTNPGRTLADVADREGWSALRFDSRGRPSAETLARSLAGYGVMVPSMLGGVAVGLLNRDRQQIVQYGANGWVDRLFAITGVSLKVEGEENLWSSRPAVFIYNHRNNFDPYVAIKLVRRDWGSVAKKEIVGPLLGPMQWLTPNVAYLDRADPTKAVQGLGPVTDLLRNGVSVLVAPEGTRSTTGQLGSFKKGPFRMAMEANVPLVPIVIFNADRVAAREAGVIRKGTIDVLVLPPVAVSDWIPEDLDEHIAEVRQLFADALDAGPDRPPARSGARGKPS